MNLNGHIKVKAVLGNILPCMDWYRYIQNDVM